jgi:hypothetical protein
MISSLVIVFVLFFSLSRGSTSPDDARTRMRSVLNNLTCSRFDIQEFAEQHLRSNGCSAFWTCDKDFVRGLNLSANGGPERCGIAGANLTFVFSQLVASTSAAINLTSVDLRTPNASGVAVRLPLGLDPNSTLQQCAIWTDEQFAAASANGPDAPCCEAAPYSSPCVTHFMDLYRKYTGLVDCQMCRGGVLLPLSPTCNDGVANGNETGIDCGVACALDCCSNGYLDSGESGIDCGGTCSASCSTEGESCSRDTKCCQRSRQSRSASPCRSMYSPRCVDAGCTRGCERFYAGWQADGTCRPLASTGVCELNEVDSCLERTELSMTVCNAAARPDTSVVLATCDVGCRRAESCTGTITTSTANATATLCFTSGQNGCPTGSTCDASGRCRAATCAAPCAEPDNLFGGCKGKCQTFPCVSTTSCNCTNLIASGSLPGTCFKFKDDSQSQCVTRNVCSCAANAVEVYLQCDSSCVKGQSTCTALTLASAWNHSAICKVSNEPCQLDSVGTGACNIRGRCIAATSSSAAATEASSLPLSPLSPSTAFTASTLIPLSNSNLSETIAVDKGVASPTDDSLPVIIGAAAGGCFLLLLLLLAAGVIWGRRQRANQADSSSAGAETSAVAPSIGEYADTSLVTPSIGQYATMSPPTRSCEYGSAPPLAGSDGSSSDAAVDARPGDTKLPVVYDRILQY